MSTLSWPLAFRSCRRRHRETEDEVEDDRHIHLSPLPTTATPSALPPAHLESLIGPMDAAFPSRPLPPQSLIDAMRVALWKKPRHLPPGSAPLIAPHSIPPPPAHHPSTSPRPTPAARPRRATGSTAPSPSASCALAPQPPRRFRHFDAPPYPGCRWRPSTFRTLPQLTARRWPSVRPVYLV